MTPTQLCKWEMVHNSNKWKEANRLRSIQNFKRKKHDIFFFPIPQILLPLGVPTHKLRTTAPNKPGSSQNVSLKWTYRPQLEILQVHFSSLLGWFLSHTVISLKPCKIQCTFLRHLFAVHHLMVKEEKHSLLTLCLRLGQLGQLPRKDEIRAPAEDVFTLHGSQ